MYFTAIDFETANERRSSACAVAVAIVREGRIEESRSWLIRPEPLEFNGFNVMIHGITEADVKDAGTFADVWLEVLESVEGELLLAHNAGFDIGVMRHSFAQWSIEHPEISYFCTRTLAKLAYPGWISYSLPVVAEHLDIELEHHDPTEDAVTCAEIALHICSEIGAESMGAALDQFGMRAGQLYSGGYRSWQYPAGASSHPRDLVPESDEFDISHPFYGRMIVFTGTLESMVRAQAMQLVVNAGGQCGRSVTKKTNYLIVGEQDFRKLGGESVSAKMRRAYQLLKKGAEIEILSESEFIQLLYS